MIKANLIFAFLAAFLGCGKPDHQLETAAVSGKITLDGAPLKSGYVFVTPSRGRMAKGTIQADGSFVLGTYSRADGAIVGTHPVTVNPIPQDEGAGSRERVSIPRKYTQSSTSGLTIEVKADEDNEVEFTLSRD